METDFGAEEIMILVSRIHLIIFLLALFSVLGGGLGRFADDPGVGWHLQSGLWMLEHRTIPSIDPFLFSVTPRHWVSDQWLSDLVLALLLNAGGFPLIYAVLIGIYLVTFFGVLAGALRRAGISPVGASIAVFLSFKIAQVHLLLRPVIFAFLCFALLLAAVLPIYRMALGEKQVLPACRKSLVIVPLLFLLWANLHPSFMLGLLTLGLVTAGIFSLRFLGSVTYGDSTLAVLRRYFILLFFCSALVTFINPFGIELHRSILSLGSSSFFMNYHQEWLSPDFSQPEGQLFQLMLFCVLLAIVFRPGNFRFSVVDLLLVAFFVHASLDAVRFLPFFGMIAAPYVAHGLGVFWQLNHLPFLAALRRAAVSLDERQRGFPHGALLSGLCLLLPVWVMARGGLPLYQGIPGPGATVYPYKALEQLKLAHTGAGPAVVAADASFGGFLTFAGGGRVLAIADDRNTLLGEDFYRSLDRALEGEGDGRAFFRSQGAHYVMLRRDSRLAERLRQQAPDTLKVSDSLVDIFSLDAPGAPLE